MIRRLTYASLSLSISVMLAAGAFAETEPKPERPDQESAPGETAADLDAFVETAIRGGLLVRNGDGSEDASSAAPSELFFNCTEPYPLDFSVVQTLRRLTELPGPPGDLSETDAKAALLKDLKSKLALGLYSEAKAMIAYVPDRDWQAYSKFIELMTARGEVDMAFFRELAACHPEANLWLAVAELHAHEPDGVQRIDGQIGAIRALPHNLRQDVSALSIPTLILQRRQDIAQQILATFTVEEIENSTQLTALKTAIIDMPDGSESDDRLVMLMSRPKLKLAALLILIERGDTLRPTIREFVLEEAWRVLEQNDTTHGFDRILAFVIQNLESDNLYSGLQRVQTLPIAQTDRVRASVDRNIIESLNSYLKDDKPAAAMKGLKTLSQFHVSLPYTEEANAVRLRGAELALELGLLSMVEVLLENVDQDATVAGLLAEAAFWAGANEDLFKLRATFPGLTEINRLAGIRAIQAGKGEIAASAYSKLNGTPGAQLDLIEQGALVENWALYDAHMAALSEELNLDEGLRLERVRRVRVASIGNAKRSNTPIRPYQIAPLLEATKLALSPPQAGASNE